MSTPAEIAAGNIATQNPQPTVAPTDTSTTSPDLITPQTTQPTESTLPNEAIPPEPSQGTPVDLSPLTSALSSVTSTMKAQNYSQADIDKATDALYQNWGIYQQQQSNQGVGGTGIGKGMISNALDSSVQTPTAFAATPQAKAGVLLPASPDDSAGDVIEKTLVNSPSDTWGIVKGAASLVSSAAGLLNPANWVTSVGDILNDPLSEQAWKNGVGNLIGPAGTGILKDPASSAGPALEQVFYGITNAASDLITGQPGKAFKDLDAGAQKALISYVNHPVSSILGPMAAAEGVGDAVDVAQDSLGAALKVQSRLYDANDLMSDMIGDPIGTIGRGAAALWNPVKTAFGSLTQSGIEATIRSTLAKTIGGFNGINGIDDVINSRPDYQALYQQLIAARDAAAKTGETPAALSTFLSKLPADTAPGFANLINQRDAYSQGITDGIPSIQKYGQVVGNTLNELAQKNGFRDADDLQAQLKARGDELQSSAKGTYEKVLNGPDGKPLPVDTTPVIKAYDAFLDRTNPATSPEETTVLRNQRDELVLRQALAETGNNLQKAGALIESKYGGMSNPDNYTDTPAGFDGVNLPKGARGIDWSKVDSSYYKELSASDLKKVAARFEGQMQGMTKPGEITKAYSDILKPAVNQSLKNAISPSAWTKYQAADANWARFRQNSSDFNLEGGNTKATMDSVFNNWKKFKAAFPDMVGKAQQMKMGQIIDEATDVDHTLGTSKINPQKLGDLINKNQEILGPQLSSQLRSIVTAHQFADTVSTARDAQVDVLEGKAKEAQVQNQLSPSDRVAFEMKARGVQSLGDVKALSESSGLTPEQLGQTAAYSIVNEVAAKMKNETGFSLPDIQKSLGKFDDIGGGSEKQAVIDQMFPNQKDGTPNAVRTSVSGLQELAEQLKSVKQKNIASKILSVSIGGTLALLGHSFMGLGFIRRGLNIHTAVPDVGGIETGEVEGHEAPPVEGIVAKAKRVIAKVGPTAKVGAIAETENNEPNQ